MWEKTTNQNVRKIEKFKCDKIQKPQNVTKLKNSKCDKNKNVKKLQNSKCDKTKKLIFYKAQKLKILLNKKKIKMWQN